MSPSGPWFDDLRAWRENEHTRRALPMCSSLVLATPGETTTHTRRAVPSDDIAWTIMRPAPLINGRGISMYRLEANFPVGNVTSRADLAAAMLVELGPHGHLRQKVAPTTHRSRRLQLLFAPVSEERR